MFKIAAIYPSKLEDLRSLDASLARSLLRSLDTSINPCESCSPRLSRFLHCRPLIGWGHAWSHVAISAHMCHCCCSWAAQTLLLLPLTPIQMQEQTLRLGLHALAPAAIDADPDAAAAAAPATPPRQLSMRSLHDGLRTLGVVLVSWELALMRSLHDGLRKLGWC